MITAQTEETDLATTDIMHASLVVADLPLQDHIVRETMTTQIAQETQGVDGMTTLIMDGPTGRREDETTPIDPQIQARAGEIEMIDTMIGIGIEIVIAGIASATHGTMTIAMNGTEARPRHGTGIETEIELPDHREALNTLNHQAEEDTETNVLQPA